MTCLKLKSKETHHYQNKTYGTLTLPPSYPWPQVRTLLNVGLLAYCNETKQTFLISFCSKLMNEGGGGIGEMRGHSLLIKYFILEAHNTESMIFKEKKSLLLELHFIVRSPIKIALYVED